MIDPTKSTDHNEVQPHDPAKAKADLAAASAPGQLKPGDDLQERQDQLLDQAVEETFPASDPISPKRITK
ncbi:hypothetical protein SAMN02799631_05925 [Methylobacterium sp. 174MFSha1.1]|uniref:hypothetical protein n=1 Tax=Methylobacterium sp. 174MFSha1.1 TaxID=1502749 RepID=UPI0008ECC0A1|nr:hypothetical protein [Methylobacterium sp. 174MFSha1.1]SFV14611.1 hypothetical protein SAMN02799631_05925 [Methylobacterium sp. 174MFSha1.1]